MVDLYHFMGLIFVDARAHAHYDIVLYTQAGLVIIHNTCENWIPQKFPTIQYMYLDNCHKLPIVSQNAGLQIVD